MVKDYKRAITHFDYKNPEKLKKYYHRVEKRLYGKYKIYKDTKWTKNDYKLVNAHFIVAKYPRLVIPIIGGSVSFCLLLMTLRYAYRDGINNEYTFFLVFSTSLLLFFITYGITQPKKEQVLNRRDGLLTMTGFFWQKDITMPFEKVEFAYSTGGENGLSAFILQVIRPTKGQTFDDYHMFGGDYQNAMTFITWYMDKNRPLPPNPEFDAYRKQDFERRKAAGFPKPLYKSRIKTPEATKAQQAERKRIGGW